MVSNTSALKIPLFFCCNEQSSFFKQRSPQKGEPLYDTSVEVSYHLRNTLLSIAWIFYEATLKDYVARDRVKGLNKMYCISNSLLTSILHQFTSIFHYEAHMKANNALELKSAILNNTAI